MRREYIYIVRRVFRVVLVFVNVRELADFVYYLIGKV